MSEATPPFQAVPDPNRRGADVVHLESVERDFWEREVFYRDLLNGLPAAVYTTDAEGRITFYNDAAVAFSGRRPELGSDQWCVTWRLFELDGTPMPHDQCPMAVALREQRAVRGGVAVAERPDGSRVIFEPYPTPLFDSQGKLVGAVNMLIDVTDQQAANERQTLLVNEVNHRANNLLSVVQSMVRIARGKDTDALRESILGRIQALAHAHKLLAKSRWMGADLQHLVTEELAPFMTDEARVWVSGTILPMNPAPAQSMALIVHELTTNAAKYGALSTEGGRVMIEWRIQAKERLVFRWTELEGPVVTAPRRSGIGSRVIKSAAAQLGGRVRQEWRETGLVFELEAPKANVAVGQSDWDSKAMKAALAPT